LAAPELKIDDDTGPGDLLGLWPGGSESGFDMAGIDQKQRYRQRAALCYEIAATISGDSATSMTRLGDTYAGLADDSGESRTDIFVASKRDDRPICVKCEKEMKLAYSLPRTDTLRAMQAFHCDHCNETMIWKGT
jgi:hypothetical protein